MTLVTPTYQIFTFL